ncbi:hypothetical protein JVU11DRAFT_8153 [Chiua virens]|nr:hypothetical protein JVU11DRAFT_8153 [Chiua virens]
MSDGWLARLLADLQLMAGKWLSKQKIEYFPALNFSQPSHPLDVVNNVLLDKNPGAHIVVTHDDDWIEMLGKGLEFSQLMEEGPVRNFMMQKRYTFDLDTEHSAVYLQRNIEGNAVYGERAPTPDCEEISGERRLDEELRSPTTIRGSSLRVRIIFVHNFNAVIFSFLADMRLESFEVDCIDAGVCVLVQFGTTTRRTKNKPHGNIVEWDDEIMLPSDMSIYVTVCGTFQLGSTLGTREISSKHTINTKGLSGSAHKIRFLIGNTEARSSLLITLERHFSYSEAHMSQDEKSAFVENTTLGFEAFYSHHREHQQKDLEAAVERFRDARNECDADPTRYATACFNLATSEFIRCQTYGMYSKLNTPIDLYRKALESRGDGHPDRPATLLLMAQALLSRHGQVYDESIAEEIEGLLTELHYDNRRDRQSADAIIATCRFYRVFNSEDPSGLDGLLSDLERGAYEPLYGYFDRPHVVHKLGLAFWRRFQSLANLDDLDKSIKLNAAALPFVPDGHDDRRNVVDCLGNSFLCGIEAREELTDLDMSIGLAEAGKRVLAKLDNLSAQGAERSSDKLREQKELMKTAENLWERIELMPAAEKLDEQIDLLSVAETLREQIEHTSAAETLRKQIERMSAADYALQAIIRQDTSSCIPEIQNLIEDWSREEGIPTECKRQLAVLFSFLEGDGDAKMRDVLEELDFEWPYKDHKIAGTSRALQVHRPYFNSVLTTQLRRSMDGWA